MTVLVADRTGAGSAIRTQPMRHPDAADRAVMTRRGWWLVILGFLIPGSPQVLAGNRKLGRFGLGATILMWTLLVIAVLIAVLLRDFYFWLIGVGWLFAAITVLAQGLLIGYAVLWIILGLNTLMLVKLVRIRTASRFGIAALAAGLLVVSSGTATYAAGIVGTTRDTLGSVFASSAPPVAPSDGYYNILLLGADSGDGRDSMRFDSISVVSINADTGAVTITGIPRDMPDVPFAPGPMQDLYPDGHYGVADEECGWTSAINQLNTELEICRADEGLYPDAVANGSTPGIEATKDAAEGVLGITIPYYVFIDMDHFAALIDALGGVQITVTERLPEGGGPAYEGQPAEDWAIGWIEQGEQHMDGNTAQWYARSRYTTSDWDRMGRQRELQEAMLKQFTPENVLSRFQEIAKAGTAVMETDVPQSMMQPFLNLALKAKSQEVQKIELTPEGTPLLDGSTIDDTSPDFTAIQQLIQERLHPPAAEDTPAP